MKLPVFQMKLGLDESSRPGWLLADEGPDEFGSIAFTIPYLPTLQPFEKIELAMAGERNGRFEEFNFQYTGSVFKEASTGVRFALHDPFAPSDFRGLPFTHAFPYIGARAEILALYGLPATASFLSVAPLDLNRMDELYLQHKIVFAGTTASFGAHTKKGFVGQQKRLRGKPQSEVDAFVTEALESIKTVDELLKSTAGDPYARAKIYEAIAKGVEIQGVPESSPTAKEIADRLPDLGDPGMHGHSSKK